MLNTANAICTEQARMAFASNLYLDFQMKKKVQKALSMNRHAI